MTLPAGETMHAPPRPRTSTSSGIDTGKSHGKAVAGMNCGTLTTKAPASMAMWRIDGADAFDPPLSQASYDVVLCRHVLWAMPDPAVALARWLRLLTPAGRLVLVEGHWSNGAGLSAEQTVRLVEETGRAASLVQLTDPAYWGRSISDERYLLMSPHAG